MHTMSALGHKQTFLDHPHNVRFRGQSGHQEGEPIFCILGRFLARTGVFRGRTLPRTGQPF